MAPGLFSRGSYDADPPVYSTLPTTHTSTSSASSSQHGDNDNDGDGDVLREEEEREKLLSGGDGLFGSIGRKVGNGSIKIGKKVKGLRRKGVSEVVEMMGGKRLGMEEGGEFGLGDGVESDSELEEDALLSEKLAFERKPRKPTRRLCGAITVLLLAFLMLLIFASLALSHQRPTTPPPPPATLSNGTHSYRPTTLLISLDGFRADFLTRNLTPTISGFFASGLAPRFMTPSFPSVTFPNHWTLATGLYPESHGIVGNTFFDPATGEEFHYTDGTRSLQRHWWGGEPIWETAEKQGVKAAVHMWPGSEAAGGWGASYVDHFNGSEVLGVKTARILDWLDLPLDDRPQFIAAYVPDVDSVGHAYGPNSTQTDAAITSVDDMVRDLLHGLDKRNLTDLINIILVSDHGMASTSNSRLIYIDDLLPLSQLTHSDGWPLYGLRPKPDVNITALYEGIKKKHTPDAHWNVYRTDTDMPPRWHFSQNSRIAPLWIVPDTGYALVTRKEFDLATIKPGETYHPAGIHGYDNLDPLMRAIFVARGPAFRGLHGKGRMDAHVGDVQEVWGGRVKEFENVEVYKILCGALGLTEAVGGNNATLGAVREWVLLEDEKSTASTTAAGSTVTSTTVKPSTATTATTTATAATKATETETKAIGEHTIPTPTGTSQADDADAEKDQEGLDWIEYVKMKAEKLKEALDKWWAKVWAEGDGDGTEGAGRRV